MNFLYQRGTHGAVYYDALNIRQSVFVEEQGVDPQREMDQLDDDRIHIVGYIEEEPIVTARFYIKKDKSSNISLLKIERVAVLKAYRGKGWGKQLIEEIIHYAKKQGIDRLALSSQEYVMKFYQHFGFICVSDVYLDAGIAHYDMTLDL